MKLFKLILTLIIISGVLFTVSCKKDEDPPQPQTNNSNNNSGGGGNNNNYTTFIMTQLKVDVMPLTNNGSSWDALSDADVYFTISDVNYNVLYTGSQVFNNQSTIPFTFSVNPNATYTTLAHNYKIALWDEDSGADEVMAVVTFNPSNYTSSYPTTISINNGLDMYVDVIGYWN